MQRKGNKYADVFKNTWNFSTFFNQQQKMSQQDVLNPVFNEDSKMGVCHFVYLKLFWKTQKNTSFVRFSDYNLNISRWGHSFLI